MFNWGQADFYPDEEDYEARQSAMANDVREVVRQLVVEHVDTAGVRAELEGQINTILSYGAEASPHYVLEALVEHYAELAFELAQSLIENPTPPLIRWLPNLVALLCAHDRAGAYALLEIGAASDDPNVLVSVLWALSRLKDLNADERMIVRELAQRTEWEILNYVLESLQKYPDDAQDEADQIAAAVALGTNSTLINAYAEVYLARGVQALSREQLDAILAKINVVNDIPSDKSALHRLVEDLLRCHPERTVRFFLDRIRKRQELDLDRRSAYHPVPYAMFSEIQVESTDVEALGLALHRVTRFLEGANDDERFWAKELFAILAGGFTEPAPTVLHEFVRTMGPSGARLAAEILRNAPSTFVCEHVELVTDILEVGKHLENFQQQRLERLLVDAVLDQRAGVRSGQIPKVFSVGQSAAASLAATLPVGTLAQSFYQELADEATRRIAQYETQLFE
jgi:hypothetical protein